mgnify:CR=1 FL=1
MLQLIHIVQPLGVASKPEAEGTGNLHTLWRFPMTEELRALQAVHNLNRKIKKDAENGIRNSWIRESKAGKCYTYRGVQYCYAM